MKFQDIPESPLLTPFSDKPNHVRRHVFLWTATLNLLLLTVMLFCDMIGTSLVQAAPIPHQIIARGSPTKPNIVKPTIGAISQTRSPSSPVRESVKAQIPQTTAHAIPMPMKSGSVDLQSGQTTHFLGSDGRLDLTIPAGAISSQDLAQAGGKITLYALQVAPASGSNAGGSGVISLGTYMVQILDAHGKLLSHGLRKPLNALYHLQTKELALHLNHAHLLLNGTVPNTQVQGMVLPTAGKTLATTLGTPQAQVASLNMTTKVLSATPLLSTPSTSLSWNSDSPIATFGKPDPSSVNLSAGALSYALPLDVPTGPGGLTPPVTLKYSSESVNEQHNVSAAANWVGEGWDLSLGAVTWSESNVTAYCPSGCGATWRNRWFLSNADGTGSELIPPASTVSTYYDDTPNNYCAMNLSPSYPCPIQWHTAAESYAKIYAYVGSVNIGQKILPPCFRVWEKNGTMEEFGCTPDSLQYYYEPGQIGTVALVTGWYLDMITDPQGNQIHLTYQQNMAPWTSNGQTYNYPRDVVLSTISYDSPGCHNAQTMCTGSNWNPLVQVAFNAGHSASLLTGNPPAGCNSGSNLRCDDPLDLSGSNGAAAPLIESTYVLNSVQVQIRSSGTASWNTLRTYNLGYEQSGPTTITDPASGLQRSVAGMLDLMQVSEVGGTGGNALLYSGMDNSTSSSFAYTKVFDVSSKNIVVGPGTTLSYWIFPQSSTMSSSSSGNNGTCVAIDMVFSDGSDLRDSGAVDQNGNRLHPAYQCGHLTLDQWNHVTSNIGAAVNGKTINRINVGYDQPGNTGGYRGYIDDISLTNPTSSTPLFATDFESGSPQPTWTNTVDTGNGGISNVGGLCCGLTGPETFVGQQLSHTDSAALPTQTFTYTSQTNQYEDDQYHPNPTSNCGPSWNTGNGTGCILWSQGYANNNRFLNSISNGQGLSQTFSWTIAHDNSHGVPGGGGNNANPFYCNANQNGYPCNEADDLGWSHIVLTQQSTTTMRQTQNGQGGTVTNTPVTSTTNYTYQLAYPLPAQMCSDCVAGMYWGDQNEGDYLSYYNPIFTGFAQATVNKPDGSVEVHNYYAGEGWGLYDTSQVKCFASTPCHNDPWWDLPNAAHGSETSALYYDTDGKTLLKQVNSAYKAVCPPAGVAATPPTSAYGNWNGHLVSAFDLSSPVATCDVQMTQQTTQAFNGVSQNASMTTNWTYDTYGRVAQQKVTANGGTPAQTITNKSYVWNDAVNATQNSANGTYIIDTPAFTDTEDGAGNRLTCGYQSYDGQSYATGQSSSLTGGLMTSTENDANCGNVANNYATSGKSVTTTTYDAYGNAIASNDPDANASIAGHLGCSISSAQHTSCTTYDTTFGVFPTTTTNTLNQTSSTSYANMSNLYGYGTWPVSTTDGNNQTTSYTYDALGRMTGQTLPGESSGVQTTQWIDTNWCSGTLAQAPCEEIDEIDRINSSTTITKRAFYDGEGRLVETRNPGASGQDVITYAYYDVADHQIFKSNAYLVSSYTGGPGASAYSIPDSTQPGISTTYDGLARVKSHTDANSFTATTGYSIVCAPNASDSGCYEQTMVIDANNHKTDTLTGGPMGKVVYTRTYTGNTPNTYGIYAVTFYQYDATGKLLSTQAPDKTTTATTTYNNLGQVTSLQDPDRGTTTSTYDPNGNLISSVDARGSAGTVYLGYDGLNRLLWKNSINSPTGAWASYSYDNTTGNMGIGKLTSESFTGSGGLNGSYAYTYDARGQTINQTVTVNGKSYPVQTAYNDLGSPTSTIYPTGEVVNANYSATGWLTGLTTIANSTTTTVASNIAYAGLAGAAGQVTGMSLGAGQYSYTASYDSGLRLTSEALANASTNTLLYQTQPAYDAANNVNAVQTLFGSNTDTQQFCYDELTRLTWAGTNGTPSCGSQSITAGSLTAAQYQQSNSYDIDGRLTSGQAGTYTYGTSSHPHAVTATSKGYSAAYDAAGNLTCRAQTSATKCSGSTPTGESMTFDAEGRLSSWQNKPSSPTSTVNYLYDGSGQRVAMQATVNGVMTTTAYIGSIEEVQSSGNSTQTTTFYIVGSKRIAAAVNGTFYYFGYDALGSQVIVLDATGNVFGKQLYGPYGANRYKTGTLPTSIGFTGQHADSVTGLDYYNARYYDPMVGLFISADTVQGNVLGMNPFAYVSGNPETMTDPTGHCGAFIGLCIIIGGAIVGAVAGAVGAVITDTINNDGRITFNPRHILAGAVVGGIAGATIAGIGVLAGPTTLLGSVFTMSPTATTSWLSAVGVTAFAGGITGLVTGAIQGAYNWIADRLFGPEIDQPSYDDGYNRGLQDGRATQSALDHDKAKPTPASAPLLPAPRAPASRAAPRSPAPVRVNYVQAAYNWASSYNWTSNYNNFVSNVSYQGGTTSVSATEYKADMVNYAVQTAKILNL